MKLKSVKLIGFKSFADAITLPTVGNMIGIVGPNGCGKSNVIDAVRWVIGETSAKQLRGQSMSDVIFNGTNKRQPLGQAAVELNFEECLGKLVGEYASFTELSIRREVNREGQSNYYINGTKCRRKDVIDIFLGTGLGPRGYSIIEQGMVSRLIEAKPEELRVYIEEAAGISKYKERRRETENRIRHTKENLDRVNDLCEEIAKQLEHLERQARAAEKYKIYKEEEKELNKTLYVLRWQQLRDNLGTSDEKLMQLTTDLEAEVSRQRELELQLETARQQHEEHQQEQQQAQRDYYGLAAEVARIEQQIKHHKDQAANWQAEFDQASALYEELMLLLEEQKAELQQLELEEQEINPKLAGLQQQRAQHKAALETAEINLSDWQERWDAYQAKIAATNQQYQVTQTKIQHLEERGQQANRRLQALSAEKANINIASLLDNLQPLELAVTEQEATHEALLETVQSNKSRLAELSAKKDQLNNEVSNKLRELAEKEAALTSLKTLQAAALGKDNADSEHWYEEQGFANTPRLAELLQVKPGYETAVESVLSDFISALCADDQDLTKVSQHLPQQSFALLSKSNQGQATPNSNITNANLIPISELMSCDWPLPSYLCAVYCADSMSQAMAQRHLLADHESIVTKDGVLMGKNWLRVLAEQDTAGQVIKRKEDMQRLEATIATLHQEKEQLTQQQLEVASSLEQTQMAYEEALEQQQRTYREWQNQLADLKNLNQQVEQAKSRLTQLEQDIADISEQKEQAEQALLEAQTLFAASESEQHGLSGGKDDLLNERELLKAQLAECREALQQSQQQQDEYAVRRATVNNQLQMLRQSIDREQRQLQQTTAKREQLEMQLLETNAPEDGLEERLQALLEDRATKEDALQKVEALLAEVDEKIRELDHARQDCYSAQMDLQGKKQACELDRQTHKVNQQNILEQLQSLGFGEDVLQIQLADDINISGLVEELQRMDNRIKRLGPINLAAIEESKALAERKNYLDQQQEDLHQALDILESAIRKIDQETKIRFKETFDKVNSGFQELFPRVFGGGRAVLELMDDDLLSTGLMVKAQPPGKKNATIHMLSGGEKALTAIALVFSLFRLNAAPFCILDEVDAPLDDANVGRYCNLIKEMASETQFLVISHNKVTIEAMDTLLGVTQQEPGVSRIVSVDMNSAVEMAE